MYNWANFGYRLGFLSGYSFLTFGTRFCKIGRVSFPPLATILKASMSWVN